MNGQLTVVDSHALVQHWLTRLRDRATPSGAFRETVRLITLPLALAALADLETVAIGVETPLTLTRGHRIATQVSVAAILRAALGMVETIQLLLPEVSVHHIDMWRDEATLQPVWGRSKLPPDCSERVWLIPDPMLATGGSAMATVAELKRLGAADIRVVCIIAAPEGIAAVREAHPDVRIFAAVVDERLTTEADAFPKGYIWPGLGDAGDRQFGT